MKLKIVELLVGTPFRNNCSVDSAIKGLPSGLGVLNCVLYQPGPKVSLYFKMAQ
jgi:hypothetical protein